MKNNAIRNSIIEHLSNLAELNEIVGPTELICGWFDDLYLPSSEEFTSQFSSNELSNMQDFHAVFASVVDFLPEASGWTENNDWNLIKNAADDVFNSFSE